MWGAALMASVVRLQITHGHSVVTDISGSGQQASPHLQRCGELVHAARTLGLNYALTEDDEPRNDEWLMWARCDR